MWGLFIGTTESLFSSLFWTIYCFTIGGCDCNSLAQHKGSHWFKYPDKSERFHAETVLKPHTFSRGVGVESESTFPTRCLLRFLIAKRGQSDQLTLSWPTLGVTQGGGQPLEDYGVTKMFVDFALDVLNRGSRFAAVRTATGPQRFQIARFESQGQKLFGSLLSLFLSLLTSVSNRAIRFASGLESRDPWLELRDSRHLLVSISHLENSLWARTRIVALASCVHALNIMWPSHGRSVQTPTGKAEKSNRCNEGHSIFKRAVPRPFPLWQVIVL